MNRSGRRKRPLRLFPDFNSHIGSIDLRCLKKTQTSPPETAPPEPASPPQKTPDSDSSALSAGEDDCSSAPEIPLTFRADPPDPDTRWHRSVPASRSS